jgi:hypothetical protein
MYEVGEGDSKIRYCFITNIDKGNGLVSITYELDVWHTYAPFMKVRDGVLGRARIGTDTLKRALPVAYETNSAPIFSNTTAKQFYLVAEVSSYIVPKNTLWANDANESIQRTTHTCLLGKYNNLPTITTTANDNTKVPYITNAAPDQFLYTIEEAIAAINEITLNQGMLNSGDKVTYKDLIRVDGRWTQNTVYLNENVLIYKKEIQDSLLASDDLGKFTYELGQIYAIPADFDAPAMWNSTSPNQELTVKIPSYITRTQPSSGTDYNFTIHFNGYGFSRLYANTYALEYNQVIEKPSSVVGVAPTIGYGLPSLFYPVAQNNLQHTVKYELRTNDYGIVIQQLTNNGLSDITAHFEVPLPFTVPKSVERM